MKSPQKSRDFSKIIKLIKTKDSDFWLRDQKERSLLLFHRAAKDVPAYGNFLKKNKIDPQKIKNWEDFKSLPLISKDNYLKRYSLDDICWDGNLKKPLIFTSTSGSTGKPFYFPRGRGLDWQYSLLVEEFLKNGPENNSPTLAIICFGMGVWIGGLITYKAFEMAAQRSGLAVSIITPGINKKEIFNALSSLAPYFKSVVLAGYPPFVKDIVDEASLNKIDLKKLNLRFIFAAEAFTETFRDYLVKKTNTKNPCIDTLNIYGTADIGAMAYETPLSVLIRRIASKNPFLFKDIFGPINKTPTLAQFNPLFINFECVGGNVILTGNNEIPLIRYSLGDHGGVFSFKEMREILKKHNVDILKEAKKAGIENCLSELPFVFVFERSDFSVTLYGLQIYPEIIRETALKTPFSEFLSGKLTMITKFNKHQDQYLEINFEMKKGTKSVSSFIKKRLLKKVVQNLRQKNSEFRELSDHLGGRANPALVFWPAEDPTHFKMGIKQKWVKKL